MRPALVPDDVKALPAVLRTYVVAGPSGDLTSTDVAPVEVFLTTADMAGETVPTCGVVLHLEDGDLDRLAAGDPVLLLFPTHRRPPVFAVTIGLDELVTD